MKPKVEQMREIEFASHPGNLGLMRAVEGYDGAMRTRFST